MTYRQTNIFLSFLALLLSFLLILPGCSGSAGDKDAVVVAVKRVRTSQADFEAQQACMEKYVESFEEANPGIKVRLVYVNEKPADISKYDALLIGADDLLYYTNGQLEELSKYYDRNGINSGDITASAVNLGTVPGKEGTFYVPFNLDRAVVIADTAMFDEFCVGFPSKDWKYSDLAEFGERFVSSAKTDGKNRKTAGIYMPVHMPCVWQYIMRATGTKWFDGKKVLFEDDPDSLQPLLDLMDLYKSGAAKGYKGKQVHAEAAMALCYVCDPDNDYIAYENEADTPRNPGSNYRALLENGTLKVLPLPNGNDGKPCGTVNTDFVRGFAVNKFSKKKDKAAGFALYSLTGEGQRILNEFYGGIPVMRSMWTEDFWKRGTLAGENGDNALIGIEYDVRDDFSELFAGDIYLYEKNMKMNGLVGAYFLRDFLEGSQTDKSLKRVLEGFAERANKLIDCSDRILF